jgi:hypothetical protein
MFALEVCIWINSNSMQIRFLASLNIHLGPHVSLPCCLWRAAWHRSCQAACHTRLSLTSRLPPRLQVLTPLDLGFVLIFNRTRRNLRLADSRMSPDLLRGTWQVDWWRSRRWWWRLRTASIRTRAVTTPRLRWLPTRAHTNWPRQEGYVPTSESRTQARTGKNTLKWQMND